MTIPVTRLKNDDGWTVVSTMAGIFVAAVVVGALSLFWMNSNKTANRVNDVSQQETAALRVLNAAAKDIKAANPIVAADSQSIVMERKENGVTVRTRYTLDKSDEDNVKLMQHINPNATDTYSGSSSWPREKVLAERAQYAGAETLFDYYDARGNQIAAPVSAGNLPKVGRVDINFRADAGKGYVELSTKVAVKKSTGMAAGGPALCDIHDFTLALESGGVQVEFRGSNAGGINRYEIFRNNVAIGTVSHSGGNAVHTYMDMNANAGETNTYRVESITTGGVRNTACAARNIFVNALPAPEIGGSLVDSNESVRLYWAAVDGANRYRVDFSPVDGSVAPATITFNAPAVGGSSTNGLWTFRNVGGTIEAVWSGSDGLLYRYTVTALAPSGATSLASNEIRLLTVATVRSITAIPQDYSVNRVQVSKRANEFLHLSTRRSVDDWWNVHTFPKQPNLSGVNQNATSVVHDDVLVAGGAAAADQSYLGWWYRYAATVSNNGPRSATPGQTYTSQTSQVLTGPAREASVLQYPADPDFVAVGTGANGISGDNSVCRSATGLRLDCGPDGRNRIHVVDNTPSNVQRIEVRSSLAADNTSGFTARNVTRGSSDWTALHTAGNGLEISGVPAASRTRYTTVAVNATGVSPNGASGNTPKVEKAFQRPVTSAVPNHVKHNEWWGNVKELGKTISATSAVTPGTSKPDGNRFELFWRWNDVGAPHGTQNIRPDESHRLQKGVDHPAEGFCDESDANCRYVVQRKPFGSNTWEHREQLTPSHPDYEVRRFEDHATNWNAKDTYAVLSCNEGGCSDRGTKDVVTYPEPFSVVGVDDQPMMARAFANTINGATTSNDWCMTPTRSNRRGCSWGEKFNFVSDALYPGSQARWERKASGVGSYEVVRHKVEGATVWEELSETVAASKDRHTGHWLTQPTSTYRYQVFAVSSHDPSLKRLADEKATLWQASPPLPAFTHNNQRCNVTDNKGGVNYDRYGSRLAVGDTAPGYLTVWQTAHHWDSINVYNWSSRWDTSPRASVLPDNWTDPGTGKKWNVTTAINNSRNNRSDNVSDYGRAMARAGGYMNVPFAQLNATFNGLHRYVDMDSIVTKNGVDKHTTLNQLNDNYARGVAPVYGAVELHVNDIWRRAGTYTRWEVQTHTGLKRGDLDFYEPTSATYGNTDHRYGSDDNLQAGWQTCWTLGAPNRSTYQNVVAGGTVQSIGTLKSYPETDNPYVTSVVGRKGQNVPSSMRVFGYDDNAWHQP